MNKLKKFRMGFTLAEVLLTLAVIGIVAAITLPSLLVDTTEKAFDAQRRALHARLAQAIGMMNTLSGYGQYAEEVKNEDGSTKTEKKDDAAETFIYEGLSKVYKINNICDSENLDKCGLPANYTTMTGQTKAFPKTLKEWSPLITNESGADSEKQTTNTKAAAFETVNGESIAVFYNPNCRSQHETGLHEADWGGDWYSIHSEMCVNFIYDLNGAKGPNKVGRDMGFITALYAKNSEVVAPVPFETDVDNTERDWQEAIELCANYSDDSRLPNKHEMSAIIFNRYFIGDLSRGYWTSSSISKDKAWAGCAYASSQNRAPKSSKQLVRCIKK